MTDHGGKRDGAGRKARPNERKVRMSLRLDRRLAAYLATVESKTATIEAALRQLIAEGE